jgi:hypothetical protein
MGFEFDHEKIPLYKLITHIIQIVLSVTIWILEIIVFKGGDINGNNGWTFGVVSLPRSQSIPDGQQDAKIILFQSSASCPYPYGYT